MTNPIDLLRAVLEHEKHGLVYFARNGSALALLQQIRSTVEPSAALDAERYRWMRSLGYSWESEAAISDMTPEQFDAAVDAARAEFKSDEHRCPYHGLTYAPLCARCEQIKANATR